MIGRLFPTVLLARKNLGGSRTRSALAALGIVIGVVAITALGMFGSAFLRAQLGTVEDLGDDVRISPAFEEGRYALDDDDVGRIRQTVEGAKVIPIKSDFVELAAREGTESVQRYGVPNPREMLEVKQGRIPANWRRGVLVGSRLAEELQLEPGDHVEVNYNRFVRGRGEVETISRSTRVHAVLEKKGRGAVFRVRNSLVMPMATFDRPVYDRVILRAESVQAAKRNADAVRETMNGRRKRVRVTEGARFQRRVEQIKSQINTFLLGVGAISLVVAGVSILNVMLMSVMERKEQIAVLRAVGYQRFAILRMVLAEALVLGLAGATVGLAVSFLVGMAINDALLGDPYAFTDASFQYALLGFGFGIGVSVVGGLYPAWKAATANTVEALRG